MNHLLNSSEWANNLWDWMAEIFQQNDKNRDSVHDSITRWRIKYTEQVTVNLLWCLGPGFVVWLFQKEMDFKFKIYNLLKLQNNKFRILEVQILLPTVGSNEEFLNLLTWKLF